jgi:predicted nucleic acid-binding protein
MQWIYFDASTLIKRYSQETGTLLVNEVFARTPANRMTCSSLGVLEIISILVRKRNDGRLNQELFEQAMVEFQAEIINHDEFLTTPVDDNLLFSSLSLITQHNLNSSDTVILRSALNLRQALQSQGDDLILLTSDKRLVRAAQIEGLPVFDPEVETLAGLQQLLDVPPAPTGQISEPTNTWDVEL